MKGLRPEENKDDKKVGVVLINWNGAEHTIRCIESLLSGSVRPDKIIVLDNASEDDSVDDIRRTFPAMEIIRSQKNLGFAAGNNVAIEQGLADEFQYLWILNNDTVVERDCLEILYRTMEAKPNIAGCTGKILYENPRRDLIWYAGAHFNYWTLNAKHRGALSHDEGQFDTTENVPFISGCSMFLRMETWLDVGEFDERFFAYYEDFDWCLRARERGLKLYYIPQAKIYHKVSASFNKTRDTRTSGITSPTMIRIIRRNRIFVIRKHWSSISQLATAISTEAIWILYYSFGLILLRRFTKLRALWCGVIEGIRYEL